VQGTNAEALAGGLFFGSGIAGVRNVMDNIPSSLTIRCSTAMENLAFFGLYSEESFSISASSPLSQVLTL